MSLFHVSQLVGLKSGATATAAVSSGLHVQQTAAAPAEKLMIIFEKIP